MDSTSTIGDKIEEYLEKKSDESNIDQSLKADPSKVQYYGSGGDGYYLKNNICKITVNHSDSGKYEPCDSIPPPYGDNDQWKCDENLYKASGNHKNIFVPPRRQHMCIKNLEKLNVEKIRDKHAFLADVLLTARNEGERIVQNHPDTNSSNVCVALERSFADLADIIRGTDQLKGSNILEQNLRRMFKKILEKDKVLQDKYQNDDENYKKLREDWWNANRQKVWEVITCSARSNDLLIKRRWTTSGKSNGENKLELFRKCGHYEEKVPTKLDYVPQFLRWLTEWIEDLYREEQNLIDDMERHREECTREYDKSKEGTSYCSTCKEKCKKYCEFVNKWKSEWENLKNKYKELYEQENKTSSSSKNTSRYDDYVKEFFKKLKGNGYSSANSYVKNDPYFAEYATKLSFIPNSSDTENASEKIQKNNDEVCNPNESEIACVELAQTSDSSSQKACITHSFIKANKKKECKDVKLGINNNDKDLKICVIEHTSLSGVENCCCQDLLGMLQENCSDKNQSGSSSNGSCDKNNEDECQKKLEKVLASLTNCYKNQKCKSGTSTVNKNWIWKKYSGTEGGLQKEYANTIALPPRTQSLCLVCLHEKEEKTQELKNISTNSELLKEWIIAAFHEGKNLKKRYHQNNNSGNKKKLCKALKYSFADYGDLIKGTSIWDNDFTKNLELNLQKIFGKLFRKYIKKNISTEQHTSYSSLDELRESWWNTNKKYIWTAMKHGAGMNGTTCCGDGSVTGSSDSGSTTCCGDGSVTGSGSSCDDIPTIDLIPQYLRFLQEWVEHFCEQRQAKVKDVIKNCNSCKECGGTCNGECKTECEKKCKGECEAYKKFIEKCNGGGGEGTSGSSWSKRWDQIYMRYSKYIEDAKRNRKAGTKNCGTSSTTNAAENKCVQSDIDSFFKHLIDIGLTTPSSYLSIVLDENICGEDKAPWTTYTTYTTEKCNKETDKSKSQSCDTLVVVNVPSPLGNTPHGYKYACQCRTPSNKELCDDRKEYMNQWISDNTKNPKGSGSGKDDYELYTYNGVQIKQAAGRSSSTKLDDKDVTFFNLFEQWNKEIQYQIEQYMTNTKISCNNEKNVLSRMSEESKNQNGSDHHVGRNNNTDQGTNCREKCKCYKLWMEKINDQWETQKKNYNKFETKQIYDARKSSQNKKVVSLSHFLFFSCWEEYIQKYFNGDWSKIKNIGSDTFEYLIKKCGNNSGDGETIFNKKLKNANIKCNENESTDTNINKSGKSSDCSEPIYIRGCQPKRYDGFISPGKGGEKQWICKDTITHGDTNGACIPPRTQNLCVGELWYKSYGGRSNIKNHTKESLKQKIKNAIQKETELLYEYHDKGTAIISQNHMKGQKGKNDPNGLPKGFCHAVQRSFIDYKNMILGTSVNTYEYIGKLQEDIKKIIEQETTKQNGKTVGSGADKVNDWWKEIEKDMWGAVKSGIKTINKKQKKNGTYTGNECGISPPTGNDEDQFVSWFKEWGEQFCIERLQYEQNIREACTNNGKNEKKCINSKSGQGDKVEGACKRKCEEYKKYISEKKQEWDKQKTKYENKYVGKSASDLLKENYPECISANFDFIFNDNIEYKTYYPYGDYSSICSCEQVKYYEYNKDNGQNNKSLCHEKGNDRTWSKKYIKKLENGRTLEGVYVPPRRQQLCLYELFPIIIKKEKDITNAKEELLETLKIVAEREAYYLWKQYHAHNPTGKGIDDANKKACCAIRGSFYDLEDIIKGNDLVYDEYTKYIDSKLNKIFGSNTNNIETKRARTDWWENKTIEVSNIPGANKSDSKTIRQLVWDAMQSGVRYAVEEKNEKFPPCMGVQHIGIAKPQFIRWLEEWTNEFCEKYTKYFEDMKSNCNLRKGADDCDDNSNIECKKACANYTNWLNPKRIEWNGMSNYYNKIYRKSNKESEDGKDYSMIMEPTVIDYLNKRCNGEINGNYICCSCKNIGENSTSPAQKTKGSKKKDEQCEDNKGPLDLMNEVLNKMDKKYSEHKMKCTEVYLEHVEEQLKEIDNAIKDYKLYPLDRCFDDQTKMKVCDLIRDAIGCKDKTKLDELDEWNDMDLRDPYNKYKGVLIPPRRRQLCFSRIVRGPANLRNLKEFKEEILKGAQSEGKFLGNYYNEDKDKEKALEAMKNSFYDYEDIIKGSDILENIQFKDIKIKLDKLLTKETNNTKKVDDWWETNKKSIWNAMLCGYKKSGNKIIDRSWCTIPTTEKTPQFLRWIKEWGTNVCIEKEKYKKNVKSECSNVTNIDLDPQASESSNCISEIKKYQEWSRNRSVQWETISERYRKYKGMDILKDVKEPDANEYLKEYCSKCPCGFNDMQEIANDNDKVEEIFNRIKEQVDIPAELEDVIYRLKHHKYNSNDYICRKYNNKNLYSRMQHNIDTIWTDLLVKKSWDINKGVLIPPRRKNLFLNIEKSDICEYKKNPKLFKDFIYSSAFTEVERLKKVYPKDRAKVVHAMKYSFADIGNIIKGDDMMENNSSDKIGKILGGDGDRKNEKRKAWWDMNKYHVWESMLCGYKEGGGDTETNENCRFPDTDGVPQFLRWFQEWTENFCTKRKELYEDVQKICASAECTNGRINESECTKACRAYENYVLLKKTEYEIQKNKYDTEFKNKNIIAKDAPDYIKEKCNDNKCECLNKHIDDKKNWKEPYETLDNMKLKGICDCPKPLPLFSDNTSDILQKTIPFGIALALGSIAFLFMKKKPKTPVDLLRVLDIPKGDYGIPTPKSSNRYIPYASDTYKGKTYIYMEGEETDDYSYIRDISSSDITSSESEYEELDINDIYVPSLPKYKTFIELVLEPSKRDTFNTSSGDTFTNKLTDDEWNQLKQDFIEQYLQNIQKDFILHDSMNEKPFITQIQDRFLDSSHEEVTYNIDWNVPENINRITNNMDDTKYSSNNIYTGTDLINDSLNGNQYIDIYDEMLKRKENELFGTYHTKYTTFNSVSKQTPSDPIINQLDLYHKWIDKHRDICEQWKTKEDMLYKSNEVWNMERKEYLLDIQPSTLDDIHKINDETYNIISTNNIYDHPSQETPLQLLGSTNIIPSYITTEQNNGLRTNISMDTYIDETNNNNVVATSIIGDDQMENSYNC
ncbi:hypothetical protein C923_03721 [Plasmodium falciparum UGT5.1]|uniref:VAR2CSA n=3 Tax=Plasmodium falciparum TaxID=5833 RepID=W7JAD2_PLAFA|nr:hypothetical protein C923_03721 [Plasmodium falciparum UGT5.1]